MNLFFCLSNLSVPTILSMVHDMKEEFVVITDNSNLYKFFSEVYNQNKVILINKFKSRTILEIIFVIPRFYFFRYRLYSQFKFCTGNNIYIYFNAFGLMESWLIKKLSYNNKIFYCPDLDISFWERTDNFIANINKIKIYLMYNVWVDPIWTGERIIYAVSDIFLSKINAQSINYTVNVSLIKNLIKNKFQIPNDSILYLTGGLIESQIIDKNEFVSKTDALLAKLKNQTIYLKSHPRFPITHSLEREVPAIESYIPANILFYSFKYVIGYSTSVLFESANTGCISISLLNYFIPNNLERKENYILYLTENLHKGKIIYFPKNLDAVMEDLRLC